MPPTLRRLLNHLPFVHGGGGAIYIKPSWHKPTPFDQWRSQPPFRPMTANVKADHFGRGLRRQRLVRGVVRWGIALAAVWLVIESVRGLTLL